MALSLTICENTFLNPAGIGRGILNLLAPSREADLAEMIGADLGLSRGRRLMRFLPVFGLVILTFGLIALFSVLLPNTFPTMLNLRAIVSDKAIIALLSPGAMIPMAAGRIDLTVGYGIVLWHILAITPQTTLGLPWPVAVAVVRVLGALTGFLNGMLVEVARIDSFIATLGTGTVPFALALWHTGGRQIGGELPQGFYDISTTFVFGLPITGHSLLAITLILRGVLEYPPVGRHLYAIGANQRAAAPNGIPTRNYVIGAFMASGTMTALAGVILASKLGIGQASVGPEFLLPALVGAFPGSTTIKPGRVNVWGTLVVLAADLKTGGILGVTGGVEEAAAVLGWEVRVLDGAGSIQGRTAAIGQALALQPDGIVINGFDAVEQQAAREGVTAAGIPMVAWHSGPRIGCDAPGGIFANISTDAMTMSEVAAKWAMEDAGGEIGAIIFTDSTCQIAIDRADRIRETIESMGGTVLDYGDTPIADTATRMGPLTTSQLQKYGDQWTHALAINDLYVDFMGPALASAGIRSADGPQAGSAGDGSEAAFQRIRSGSYQTITVAEPPHLQGRQLVDALNRAMQGQPCSGYVPSPERVTQDGLAKLGDSNQVDPDIPYRATYTAIWDKERARKGTAGACLGRPSP